jgi:hypothetical protein
MSGCFLGYSTMVLIGHFFEWRHKGHPTIDHKAIPTNSAQKDTTATAE